MESAAPASASTSTPSSSSSSAPSSTSAPASGASPSTPTPGSGAPSGAPSSGAEQMYEVMVDGQPQKVSLEQMRRDYQRAAAANKRFEEAQKAKAEAERIRAELAKDPWSALKAAGLDPDQLAQKRILEAIEREQMTPEQRALAEERQKRESLERQMKEQQEAQQRTARETETKAYVDRFNQELPAAMEAAGLPRDPEAARIVVSHMANMARLGLPVDVKWAAQDAVNVMVERYAPVFAKMSPDRLVQALGKPAIDALQKHIISQATSPQPKIPSPAPAPSQPRTGNRYGMSPDEWRARFGRDG